MMTDRRAWLKARNRGIGGSDAAVVMNLNPWKSAFSLWAEKTGKVTPDDLSDNEAVEWGNLLEEPIARKFAEVTKRIVMSQHSAVWPFVMEDGIVRHPDKPFMIGTPDRLFKTPGSPYGVLEIKTTGTHRALDWAEEPPVHYQIQLQHYLAVTGLSYGAFAVLIGGQKFHWRDVERNDRFISLLIEKEEKFWDCVQRDVPPPVDASKSTAEALARLYAAPDESVEVEPVMLSLEFADMADRRRELIAAIKAYEVEKRGIENEIKAALGNSVFGYLPDGSGFSWKMQHREPYIVPESSYRVLREIQPKKGT